MKRILAVCLLLLVVPSAASAATIERKDDDLVYVAAPGEVNTPAITRDKAARTVTITDPGATITATDKACTLASGVVTCAERKFSRLDFRLGDMDDTLVFEDDFDEAGKNLIDAVDTGPGADSADVAASRVDGGEGDDEIVNRNFSVIRGGAGDDRLSLLSDRGTVLGGPGVDTLTGDDEFQTFAGGPGVDTIDAGTGEGQIVSFAGTAEPVVADVGADGPMGPAAEQDMVSGVDGVIGGDGDDVLTGDDRGNRITGGPGDDALTGNGGDDELSAGKGTDQVDGGDGEDEIDDAGGALTPEAVLDGGAGPDVIKSRDSGAAVLGGDDDDELFFGPRTTRVEGGAGDDSIRSRKDLKAGTGISCGDGRDVVYGLGLAVIPADCELIGFLHPKVSALLRNEVSIKGSRLTIPVPYLCDPDGCTIKVEAKAGKSVIAGGKVKLRRFRENGRLTVALTAAARRAVRKAGQVTVVYESRRAVLSHAVVTFAVSG
jgi:Ca2+-binding RTX toxin-like protein